MKLVFFVAGSFHLGQAGCYGNDWTSTPALDGLAAESVVFDQHFADAPSRPAAWRAWLSGLALLQQAGVAVRIISDRPPACSDLEGWQQPAPTEGQLPFEAALQASIRVIDEFDSDGNWLVFIETGTLLPPWPVLEEEAAAEISDDDADDSEEDDGDSETDSDDSDEEIEDIEEDETEEDEAEEDEAEEDIPPPITEPPLGPLGDDPDDRIFVGVAEGYSGGMMELDAGLEWLREQLEGRGLLDDVAFVLTSDRGYPLGEHGVIGEEPPNVFEESVHVPLMLRLPGRREAGRRVAQLTQPADVSATILDLFGLAPDTTGKSVLPLAEGQLEGWRTTVCSHAGAADALRTNEWCLFVPEGGPARLYVKPDDRWEVNDVAQHHPELVEELCEKLRASRTSLGSRLYC
jgi:arylsulfatase A-like enzyme